MSKLTYEQALVQLYTKAEISLIKTIKKKAMYGNVTTYERSLLRQVDEQIKKLRQSSDKLIQQMVKKNYKSGLEQLVKDLSIDKSAPTSYNLMSGLNTNQINIIVDNLTHQLNMATATIGRRCDDLIRKATLEATAKKLTTGQTVREMQKELEKRLLAQDVTAVTYSNGTKHNIKDYVSMVSRTTTAETQNTAQLVQGKEWGYDLVRMTSHYPTCEVCAKYQGRVYATTKEASNGKYKDNNGNILKFAYIYDTVLVDGYDTVHPNCRHRFAIFPPNAYTLEELSEFSQQSMQPFEDTRSDKERKEYAQEQAVKRKRNASRRQYEDIKRYLPDQAPKTFAGWQKMKSANSQRYQDLLEDYRFIKKSVASSSESGIIKSGGKITDKNFMFIEKFEKQAKEFYRARIRNGDSDVLLISQNTDFTYDEILAIKNHIMVSEHLFNDGSLRKFDPDIDQALAWQRLMKNKAISSDILMLNHEFRELKYIEKTGCSYEVAHNYSSEKYDWQSVIDEIVDTDEIDLKLLK